MIGDPNYYEIPALLLSNDIANSIESSLFHHFKPFNALSIALDGLEEHLCGAYPQAAFTIQGAVDDHLLQCLGVLGEPFKAIEVSLEMPKLSAN